MMFRVRKQTAVILATISLLLGCDMSSGTNPGEDMPEGTTFALVVTTDYQTGSYAAVDTRDLSVSADINIIHQDAVCRFDPFTATPFVVARLGADAVDVIDPSQGWSIVSEYSVTASTNPQDIAVYSKDRAYVTRLGVPDLLVVHPIEGTVIDSIDLSHLADSDGNPEASWTLIHSDKLFVSLQNLVNYEPTGSSSVAVLDPASGEILDVITLTGSNAYGKMRYSEAMSGLVLIEAGRYGELDGGIEIINPVDNSVSGFIIDETTLGGDLSDAVIASETVGFAAVGIPFGEDKHNSLVSFNPSTGEKTGELLVKDDWWLGFIELTPDGKELWVSDRSTQAPGVRIFDTVTGEELTEEPISTGLPPFMICFVQG